MTRSSDIQTVIREVQRLRTTHLDVRVLASPLAFPRVGVVVPRHQHTAVDRNLLKRRLRELVRLRLLPLLRNTSAMDVAIRARREAYLASMDALQSDVDTVTQHVTTKSPSA